MNEKKKRQRRRQRSSRSGKRRKCCENEITEAEIDTNSGTQQCYCISKHNLTIPYIGYTVNTKQRIRKHKGTIKGGAKKTIKMCGDIRYIAIVEPFLCSRDALQFEWAWNAAIKKRTSFLKRASDDALIQPNVSFLDEISIQTQQQSSNASLIEGNDQIIIINNKIEENKEEIKQIQETSKKEEIKKETTKEKKKRSKNIQLYTPGTEMSHLLPLHLPIAAKKLTLRLLELLACECWTTNAVPTTHEWRRSRMTELAVHWHVDPRIYNIDPMLHLVSLPVRHYFPTRIPLLP